jgi:hypothetical protein
MIDGDKKLIKLAKILIRTWPATIFAHKRMARLIGLERKEMISTGIKIGAINKGKPLGKKVRKNPHLCFTILMVVADKKTSKANVSVTEI